MTLEELISQLDPACMRAPGFLQALYRYAEHTLEQEDAEAEAAEAKARGADEDVSTDLLFAVFDQRHITSRPRVKWYNPNTQLGDRSGGSKRTLKKGVCVHHTAVRGGFGADRSLIKRYMAQGTPEYHADLWRVFPRNKDDSPRWPSLTEWARAMALAHRFRGDPPREYNYGVPYHAISAANSVLYLNLPFDWVTWHGDRSNADYLGFAWDASSAYEEPRAQDQQADLAYVVQLAREEGHPIEFLTCHCAWSNKPRDPGKAFIEQVMVPVAEACSLTIDWDFKDSRAGARSLREITGRTA